MSIVKLNNQAVKDVTTVGSISTLGSLIFIKKITASSSASISFVDGSSSVVFDDTYREYLFFFNNIHGQTLREDFTFQCSTDGGSNYNTNITSTYYQMNNQESGGSNTNFGYLDSIDQAGGTGFQYLARDFSDDNDGSLSGYLHIFQPSSTTFVKHWMSTFQAMHEAPSGYYTNSDTASGYFNTTSAINAIQFKATSGNIDAGEITLFGIS
tara:strand:+ start:1183 stop:1815 length:633 start_codon:yes stop_codon:yes gene_type:complete